jgi:CRISPR-associated protein Csd1
MILQELTRFYNRLLEDPNIEICEPGFSMENISFKIVIDETGKFIGLEDLRVQNGKNARPVKLMVPKFDGKRTSGVKPYFLWDKSDYTVGYALNTDESTGELVEVKKPKHHAAFIDLIETISKEVGIDHAAVNAVRYFSSSGDEIEKLKAEPLWQEFLNSFAVFEVEGYGFTVFNIPEIAQGWKDYYSGQAGGDDNIGICSVLGKVGALAASHPTIKKGVGGKNDTPLVSCNVNSCESYGKKKGGNAPISAAAASSFTGALNYLTENRRHNLRIADTLTLFWAENNRPAEHFFSALMDRPDTDDEETRKELETFLKEMQKGKLPSKLADESRFFVLGLAPNSARISVRFWHTDTVREMGTKVVQHFRDMQIVPQRREKDSANPSIWQLLIETATQHKTDNIPPNIAGPLMRSILSGTQYPSNILSILIGRMRTDQEYRRLNYYRASFIKAILNRNFNKELTVALDAERKTAPYSLGRLFAVLERTQEDASGGNLNATIKDRYFASASATPRVVFPVIIKLAQNHLKKIKSSKPGLAVNKEKLIGAIMEDISDFPKSLKLEDQGEFAIGYYHQRQDFFKKKTEEKTTETEGDM